MPVKTFNFYCDESSHIENDHKNFMVIGYIAVPFNKIKDSKEKIHKIRTNHNMFYELKWTKISQSALPFYIDIIEYFFASDLSFRAIIVDKRKIMNSAFNQDYETFYYKMYYQLLVHKLDMSSNYNIYVDYKDSLAKYRIEKLKGILNYKFGVIKNIQSIRSEESMFVQMCDVFIGSLSYFLNDGDKRMNAKTEVINTIQKLSGLNYCYSTYQSESKFNLFYINL